MDSGLIALGAAVVGVAGTLLATVLSQRMLARVQAAQFEREQRVDRTRWQREQELAELARRRECYAAANAAYRRYRIGLMSFLWLVQRSQVTPEERATLEEVRNVHHTVFAEAQMIASAAVLAQLDIMTRGMAGAYARTMRLAEGTPHPDGSFEEIHTPHPAHRPHAARGRHAGRDAGRPGRGLHAGGGAAVPARSRPGAVTSPGGRGLIGGGRR
ncbi:hypothetical protein ABT024_01590 [Streptomyces sp. NPDC002812]|uniref:hypothetical protein n=1 Tax=Streptomyces sp. NPDC002812 TaxID=3154434 RepID=UPI00332DA6D8